MSFKVLVSLAVSIPAIGWFIFAQAQTTDDPAAPAAPAPGGSDPSSGNASDTNGDGELFLIEKFFFYFNTYEIS